MKLLKYLVSPIILIVFFTFIPVHAQDLNFERERHKRMLERIKDEVKKNGSMVVKPIIKENF